MPQSPPAHLALRQYKIVPVRLLSGFDRFCPQISFFAVFHSPGLTFAATWFRLIRSSVRYYGTARRGLSRGKEDY
jgi:hypothetical protein